jgi:hypothetical protein
MNRVSRPESLKTTPVHYRKYYYESVPRVKRLSTAGARVAVTKRSGSGKD